jgi:hypothetical protein
VIFWRKFTMRTCPKWTVSRRAGANDRIIPPQYRHALANSFVYPVMGEVPGVAVHYVDHPVRN